jgi:hypothetical protein
MSVQLFVFLVAEGLKAEDIHKEISPAYGGKCLSRAAVHSWVGKFSQVSHDALVRIGATKGFMLRISTHR